MSTNVTNPSSYVKPNPALTKLLNEVIARMAAGNDDIEAILPADDDDPPADDNEPSEVM